MANNKVICIMLKFPDQSTFSLLAPVIAALTLLPCGMVLWRVEAITEDESLSAESNLHFKVILCTLYHLKRHLNIL
jgi:hypothetical protein